MTPNQRKLIDTLKTAGKKVVTLLFTGRPMCIASVVKASDAVVQVWFPGTEGALPVSVLIENTGKVTGETVVQLYIRDISASVVRPLKELKAFKKIKVQPGEKVKVEFLITKEMLSFYDNDENFVFEKGMFEIMVGQHAEDVLVEKLFGE